MNRTIKQFNRTILLACTPFIGAMIWLLSMNPTITLSSEFIQPNALPLSKYTIDTSQHEQALTKLDDAAVTAGSTQKSIHKQLELYKNTNAAMQDIASTAAKQAQRPLLLYDKKITSKLGNPASTINSNKLRAQLFYGKQDKFNSYLVKIQLKSDDAMSMVLGGGDPGTARTTLEAVQQHKAAVGINAGGFADSKGKRYPLSTTVMDGKYINGGFEASYADLFFVGLSSSNKLIGGNFSSKQQLDKLNPKFGASFVPVLLKNGAAQSIPDKWKTSPARAPRTIIANYKDNQLLLLVTDGYNKAGSVGATLEEIQALLKSYGIKDGYNLDGGGSSTLVFNGKVINHPSDGQMRKLPTHFLFYK